MSTSVDAAAAVENAALKERVAALEAENAKMELKLRSQGDWLSAAYDGNLRLNLGDGKGYVYDVCIDSGWVQNKATEEWIGKCEDLGIDLVSKDGRHWSAVKGGKELTMEEEEEEEEED